MVSRRILQVSLRADPLSAYRGGPIGGQQVRVDTAVRAVQGLGWGSDVLTAAAGLPEGSALGQLGRVVRLNGLEADADEAEALARLTRLLGEWLAARRRAYYLAHSYSWYSAAVTAPVVREAGLPWVHSPGSLPPPTAPASDPLTLMARQLAEADRVVVSSAEQARRARAWAPTARVAVVPPGVDTRTFFPRDAGPTLRRLNIPRRYVLTLTGTAGDQAVAALAEAWRGRFAAGRIPEGCWLVVLGPGAEALDAPAVRIRAPGAVGRRQMPGYYAGASCLVLPAVGTEGLPVLEAMASGVPVVLYDTVADMVEPGTTGLVVPAGDVDGLVDAAQGLWDDLPRMMRLGARAAEAVMAGYTLERVGRDLAQIYREVAGLGDGAAEA